MTTDFILCRSEVTGTVEAVQTSKNILYGRKAFVIASGAWTRSLLHSFLEPALTLDIPVKPRKVYLKFLGLIFVLKILVLNTHPSSYYWSSYVYLIWKIVEWIRFYVFLQDLLCMFT